MVRSKLLAVVLTLGMVGAVATPTFAQDAGGGGGGRGNGGGGGGGPRMTREEMRAEMAKRTQEAMGATDTEWAVLGPKIEKVQTMQFQAMAGRGMGMGRGGRGGGPGGPAAAGPSNPVADAVHELQTLLDNKDATPEQIKAKLTALRDARAKAKEELTKAQTELREVLSVRQEAVLVERGMLD